VASTSKSDLLRQIPSIDELLRQRALPRSRLASTATFFLRSPAPPHRPARPPLADADSSNVGAHGRRTVILSLDPAALQTKSPMAVDDRL